MDHSKRAMKKTVASFICLAILMLISFIISTYEYTHGNAGLHEALKKVGHHIRGKSHKAMHHQLPEVVGDSSLFENSTETLVPVASHHRGNKSHKHGHHQVDEAALDPEQTTTRMISNLTQN